MDDELSASSKRLKSAHDSLVQDLDNVILALNNRDTLLKERLQELNRKKHEIAQTHGNLDATDDDLIEINAGGKIIVAKRSTLTQIQGSRMEALFSGRWDKKLMRDGYCRIFLDVDPTCFQAIVDYLNEMTISSKDSPPSPPSVNDDHKHILNHQLELFGLGPVPECSLPDSNIIKDVGDCVMLHDWLEEDGQDGEFSLLYRGSRDGQTNAAFHSKCDNKGCTLTVIKTTCGKVFGGYSNTAWSSTGTYKGANKAFLFALSDGSISSPDKMKLNNENDSYAICCASGYGPIFGGGSNDIDVRGSTVYLRPGRSYDQGPLTNGDFTIEEMEVFLVTKSSTSIMNSYTNINPVLPATQAVDEVTRFSDDMNKAINAKQACLFQAEYKMLRLEESFTDEQTFIDKFATGDTKDVIVLNVSGTVMTTKRCTLCAVEDSVLAQQFDDSKWTEQGCNSPCVKEWTPEEVSTWAKSINHFPVEVSVTLYENKITGEELLALRRDDLKTIGIERVGTLALLLKEIEKLDKGSLIEYSPYCIDKILNHLRLMQLHSIGLIVKEPSLPEVDKSQKQRFETIVKYYFPGDSAKTMLG
jgi:flagellar motor switch/type III secretory pathway protein FliN